MLLGPLCVGGLGGLAEAIGGPIEHEAYVDAGVTVLDADVLGAVCGGQVSLDL